MTVKFAVTEVLPLGTVPVNETTPADVIDTAGPVTAAPVLSTNETLVSVVLYLVSSPSGSCAWMVKGWAPQPMVLLVPVYCAVPSAWKEFAFYQVPAESGIRVSGAMHDGAVQWLTYAHDGKLLHQATAREGLRISHSGGSLSLVPAAP